MSICYRRNADFGKEMVINMKLTEAYQKKQLIKIINLYRKSFPRAEKKPFLLMLKKRKEGSMEILSIEDDNGGFLGLAILVLYRDLVLLDYFAVSPKQRDGGIGSAALQMLKARYFDKKFFLEIESTKGEAANIELRKRRKEFYLRNGMTNLPFDVNLFGIDMELLGDDCSFSFHDYYELYQKVFGKMIAGRVKLLCN